MQEPRLEKNMDITQQLMKEAIAYCTKNKHRVTDPRMQVLTIVSDSHQPLGAYDILKKLAHGRHNPKPPTVYRAIEFWQEHGFIHRIESLNAYVTCNAGHRHKGSQFMICNDCGIVIETHLCDIPKPLKDSIAAQTFAPTRWNFEIHGTCKNCT